MIFRYFYDTNLGTEYLRIIENHFKNNYNLNHKLHSFNISKKKNVLELYNINYIPCLLVSSSKHSNDAKDIPLFDINLEKKLKELMKTL